MLQGRFQAIRFVVLVFEQELGQNLLQQKEEHETGGPVAVARPLHEQAPAQDDHVHESIDHQTGHHQIRVHQVEDTPFVLVSNANPICLCPDWTTCFHISSIVQTVSCFEEAILKSECKNNIDVFHDFASLLIGAVGSDQICGEYNAESDKCTSLPALPKRKGNETIPETLLVPLYEVINSLPEGKRRRRWWWWRAWNWCTVIL